MIVTFTMNYERLRKGSVTLFYCNITITNFNNGIFTIKNLKSPMRGSLKFTSIILNTYIVALFMSLFTYHHIFLVEHNFQQDF